MLQKLSKLYHKIIITVLEEETPLLFVFWIAPSSLISSQPLVDDSFPVNSSEIIKYDSAKSLPISSSSCSDSMWPCSLEIV